MKAKETNVEQTCFLSVYHNRTCCKNGYTLPATPGLDSLYHPSLPASKAVSVKLQFTPDLGQMKGDFDEIYESIVRPGESRGSKPPPLTNRLALWIRHVRSRARGKAKHRVLRTMRKGIHTDSYGKVGLRAATDHRKRGKGQFLDTADP